MFPSSGRQAFGDQLEPGSDEEAAFLRDLYGVDGPTAETDNAVDLTACGTKFGDSRSGNIAFDQFDELHAMVDQLILAMVGSSEYADLNAEWAACMSSEGFPEYGSPVDAIEYFDDFLGIDVDDVEEAERIARSEVEVASADFDCRDQVDYSDGIRSLIQPQLAQVVQRFPQALELG